MSELYIQVFRAGEWRTLTTVRIAAKAHVDDKEKARATAFHEASRHRDGWQRYDTFAGLPLRIAESVGYGELREARV